MRCIIAQSRSQETMSGERVLDERAIISIQDIIEPKLIRQDICLGRLLWQKNKSGSLLSLYLE